MPHIEEVVPAALAGERLDRVVAMLSGVTRSAARDLVEAGRATVDGSVVTRAADRVDEGATLAFDTPEPSGPSTVEPDPSVSVPVVHEDAEVIVVDKPAGMVVHPGAGHEHATMAAGLLARYPELAAVGDPQRPGIVHRLDKGTSGLLVVARTPDAHRDLVAQLAARSMDRRYRTLAWGHLDNPQGVIDAPIGRSARTPTKMGVTATGRAARTRYEVVEAFDEPTPLSLLECRLETGRTHQIRVHLSAIGHPVVGDGRYGGARPGVPCPRPFLHAEHLGFEHPGDRTAMAFDSALPDDLRAVLDGL